MKKTIMAGILVGFLVMVALPLNAQIEHIALRVDGLSCPFCAYGLEKKITGIKDVRDYDVDMKEGKVFIRLKSDAQIEINSFYKVVEEAGFTLRSISLRVKGKIQQSEEGLILVTERNREKFLLFESEALLKKYHQGKLPKALEDNMEKKLIGIKEQGKEVLIEGVIHEHEGFPAGLAVERLEVFNGEK